MGPGYSGEAKRYRVKLCLLAWSEAVRTWNIAVCSIVLFYERSGKRFAWIHNEGGWVDCHLETEHDG